MTWTNGSNAYSERASYGDIADQIKTSSQKYTAKNRDAALHQTRVFIEGLPAGTYQFQYPLVLPDIVHDADNLQLVAYNTLTQTATVVKS